MGTEGHVGLDIIIVDDFSTRVSQDMTYKQTNKLINIWEKNEHSH